MSQLVRLEPSVERPELFTPRQRQALGLLEEAWNAAEQQGRAVWQFAVELHQFHALGLSHTELRLLLCEGYLEHARERIGAAGTERTFHRLGALSLPPETCFVLTAKGWEAIHENAKPRLVTLSLPAPRDVPRWDDLLRQLWWKDLLIKHYHTPAENQERVLQAFEEDGWPVHLDDPLPARSDVEPKVRLHDTIKALNRAQQNRLLHFRSVGNGKGICWEKVVRGRKPRMTS